MLRLHNTLTRNTDTFTPIEEGKVKLYTCGPTVYNSPHVGNWVPYVRWDTLVRVLRANGFDVERSMNITDVGHLVSDEDEGEDKMQKGARREGITAWEVAKRYTAEFLEGMKELNMIMPEHIIPATEYIPQQLALIRTLKEKGYTYQISDGIYYDTSKFPAYANFAQLDLDAMRAGARVEFNPEKRNISDFALWKFSPLDEQRDMEWETPRDVLDDNVTKMGFPGWHIECSAIAMGTLGETLDIHTGGVDHIPVHHTNEIAQSEAATGKPFAHYWLHNNHIKVDGTKISKSLGNGYVLKDLQEKGFDPLDYRMFILQSHYRTESNFSWENLEAARNRRKHWQDVAVLRWQSYDTLVSERNLVSEEHTVDILGAIQSIKDSLNDDLDTPEALRIIDDIFSRIEKQPLQDVHQDVFERLLSLIDELLGLRLLESTPDISNEVKQLVIERQRVRDSKDWQRSDVLRDQLLEAGVRVRDSLHGPIWSYA